MNKSQNPKTGLARTSKIAYETISASTLTFREPSARPQTLIQLAKPCRKSQLTNIHWVHGPEDQCEAGNSLEERGSLGVLVLDRGATVNGELVDDNEIGDASNGIVSPFGALVVAKGSKETGQDHDNISNDGNEDVGAAQASEEGKVHE